MPENAKAYLTPKEISAAVQEAAVEKAGKSAVSLLVLGFLAGAFIAFASEGSTMAAFNLLAKDETFGLGKAVAGAIFGTGLMLVVIAGGELFTGNTLMVGALPGRRIRLSAMLRNWGLAYLGNFLGSLCVALLMWQSGLFASAGGQLGGMTIKIAAGKTALGFGQAVALGILCNWLVCLAVWMSYGATDLSGKIWAVFFPIWLFITSGFEHSVANMYYIPAGILAALDEGLVRRALEMGLKDAAFENLGWLSFLFKNLLPVTLGNILGGSLFVMGAYLVAYGPGRKDSKAHSVLG